MNVRYGPPGKLIFDYAGNEITIREPMDVLLVGQDAALVESWIKRHYGYLLSCLETK